MLSRKDFEFKKLIVVFLNQGEKISFQNDNLLVKNNGGKILHQSTCYRIFSVLIVGSFTITSGLLQRAKRFGFSIILLSHSFRPYMFLGVQAEGNTLLRSKQYGYSDVYSLELAKHIICNKIANQAAALQKARQVGTLGKEVIRLLRSYEQEARNCSGEKQLLGLEGSAAKNYFKQMFIESQWNGRRPRIKQDITNCLLDIGYTLLFCFIECLLNCYGFDLYKGFYHKLFYQRKSLVCDLVEPFRPIIDYKIRKMGRLGMINENDFFIEQGSYYLAYARGKPYISQLLGAIMENKDDIFCYIRSFYRCYMKLEKTSAYPVFQYE